MSSKSDPLQFQAQCAAQLDAEKRKYRHELNAKLLQLAPVLTFLSVQLSRALRLQDVQVRSVASGFCVGPIIGNL